jgi:hypothetical protein
MAAYATPVILSLRRIVARNVVVEVDTLAHPDSSLALRMTLDLARR